MVKTECLLNSQHPEVGVLSAWWWWSFLTGLIETLIEMTCLRGFGASASTISKNNIMDSIPNFPIMPDPKLGHWAPGPSKNAAETSASSATLGSSAMVTLVPFISAMNWYWTYRIPFATLILYGLVLHWPLSFSTVCILYGLPLSFSIVSSWRYE